MRSQYLRWPRCLSWVTMIITWGGVDPQVCPTFVIIILLPQTQYFVIFAFPPCYILNGQRIEMKESCSNYRYVTFDLPTVIIKYHLIRTKSFNLSQKDDISMFNSTVKPFPIIMIHFFSSFFFWIKKSLQCQCSDYGLWVSCLKASGHAGRSWTEMLGYVPSAPAPA